MRGVLGKQGKDEKSNRQVKIEKRENKRKTRQDSIFMHDGFSFFVFF